MTSNRFTYLHGLIGMALFVIYGVQVCPFLESQSALQLAIPVFISFCLLFVGRTLVERRLQRLELSAQVITQFRFDIQLFVAAGAIIACYNATLYSAPIDSSLKVIIGMIAIGFFVSCDLALAREHRIALAACQGEMNITPDEVPLSITRKFSLIAAASALISAVVMFLVINKDLEWLMQMEQHQALEHRMDKF